MGTGKESLQSRETHEQKEGSIVLCTSQTSNDHSSFCAPNSPCLLKACKNSEGLQLPKGGFWHLPEGKYPKTNFG